MDMTNAKGTAIAMLMSNGSRTFAIVLDNGRYHIQDTSTLKVVAKGLTHQLMWEELQRLRSQNYKDVSE